MRNTERQTTLRSTALLAFAVVFGWTTYDLCQVAVSSEPYLVSRILPAYAVTLLLAAVIGVVSAVDRRVFWTFLMLSAVASIGLKLAANLPWHLLCLPRALFLIFAAVLAADALAQRSKPAVWPAVGLGAIAAAGFACYLGTRALAIPAVATLAGSLLVASTALAGAAWRRTVIATALVIPLALATTFSRHDVPVPRAERPAAAAPAAGTRAPNLILIVLDTVSAHHLSPYGYHRVTTPGLDAFVSRRAVRYTQARSVSSWTLPSHASIFTGLYPSQHGADHPRLVSHGDEPAGLGPAARLALDPAEPLRHDVPTLAERLRAAGYQTAAVVANCGYLSHEFGVDRGFEQYDDREAFTPLLLIQLAGLHSNLRKGTSRRAETITDRALDWIDAGDRRQPFFLFLNYMDAHAPYLPPRPYDRAFVDERPRPVGDDGAPAETLAYDAELRYLDAHVTRFLDALEARNLLNDTVLVITSDHGEAFGQHGFWKHDKAIYEPLIRVPLYVKSSGTPKPGVSDRIVTSPDLYHLMLTEVGLATAPPGHDSPIVAEWYQTDDKTAATLAERGETAVPLDRDLLAWVDAGIKWIVNSRGDVEAYDLTTDPGEIRPLDLSPDRVEHARARAQAWWRANPPVPRTARPAAELDPAVIDRLRNLGYVH